MGSLRKGNNGKINLKTGKIFLCLSIPDFLFPGEEREKCRENKEKKREKLCKLKNEKPEESKSSSRFLYKRTVAEL